MPRSLACAFLALAASSAALSALPAPRPQPPAAAPAAPPASSSLSPGPGWTVIDVPPSDVGADTLAARQKAELATVERFQVPIDFHFHDGLSASGIKFRHLIVDDAGKTYKAAHYDHGNGIAAADVDGDGKVDLYFTTQLGKNALYKNLGGGAFQEITDAALALEDQVSVSAAFGDVNDDGAPDLYVTTVRHGNHLFLNDGKGHFKDVTKDAGVGYVGHSSGAVFFDYDRDGKLDLFVVNVGKYTTEVKGRGGFYVAFEDAFQGHLHPERSEHSVLYHNLGGNKFEDVTEKMGLTGGGWSGDASAVDFNGDGFPDLYVLSMQGQSRYWENQGGKSFADKTKQYFPRTSWGAMGIKFFDYDNDGDADLFVTDMHSDMFQESVPQDEKVKYLYKGNNTFLGGPPESFLFGNAFYKNQGDGTFKDATDEVSLENYWPWGVSVGDVNADGFLDVFIASSMNYPWRYGVNSLMVNNQGQDYLNAEFITGIEPRPGSKTRQVWFTLDCDGEDKAHRSCQGRRGKVAVTGTLGTRSSVLFDLDGDGDLDLVTNEFNDAPQVLINDLAAKHPIHYLEVRLRGTTSNRDGLGATVRVTAGGKTYTQFHDGASGYLSHSLLPLYFGLGKAEKVEKIEVTWPSGKKQTVAGPLAANRIVDVVEDGAKAEAKAKAGKP